MPPPKGVEEEVKEGTGLKLLTPNKLLTRQICMNKSWKQFRQIKK